MNISHMIIEDHGHWISG